MRGFVRFAFQVASGRFVRLLHCILRRLCEMVFRNLPVVLDRHGHAVAEPGGCDVSGELVDQFGFAGAAQVLSQLRPRFEAGPLDDPLKLGSQVHCAAYVWTADTIIGYIASGSWT